MRANIPVRYFLQALALICALAALISVADASLRGGHWAEREREEFVRITGFTIPTDGDEQLQVFTDRGAFEVETLSAGHGPRQDPWFRFKLGEHYRVRVRGQERETLLGRSRPRIVDAQPVSLTAQGAFER